MASQEFRELILGTLLPEFCNDPSRGYGCDGFKADWSKVADKDAEDFLVALELGLIEHRGRGLYRASRSKASEQFFWQGRKDISPRPVTLWVEPIITVAALFRLVYEFGWRKDLVGTQSKGWEFDVTAFHESALDNEYIACEVKKSVRELDELIKLMIELSTGCGVPENKMSSREKNAFRKLKGLQERKPPIFWALGPDRANRIFQMTYMDDGQVVFNPANYDVLQYPRHKNSV
jgi:hypothetical protein